jgi:hypothetical protein
MFCTGVASPPSDLPEGKDAVISQRKTTSVYRGRGSESFCILDLELEDRDSNAVSSKGLLSSPPRPANGTSFERIKQREREFGHSKLVQRPRMSRTSTITPL